MKGRYICINKVLQIKKKKKTILKYFEYILIIKMILNFIISKIYTYIPKKNNFYL